jgi:HEAT repeat protein
MLKDPRAVPELIPKLKEQSPDVRAAVANGLGGLHDKTAVPALLPLLKDDSNMVKVAAALALADIGDKAAVSPLKEAIASEKDDEVHTQLTEALKRLQSAPDQT